MLPDPQICYICLGNIIEWLDKRNDTEDSILK